MFTKTLSAPHNEMPELANTAQTNYSDVEQMLAMQSTDLYSILVENKEYFKHVVLSYFNFVTATTDDLILPAINKSFSKEGAIPDYLKGSS
ncbi:MAG: hypothetical protein HRU20_27800 [Pseudomonadales bacterium]|nr:hypothetical protein [Pseudomonadales bacterium]